MHLKPTKYQEKVAHCHFGREPFTKGGFKFFVWEKAMDLSKYKSMDFGQVTAALGGLCKVWR